MKLISTLLSPPESSVLAVSALEVTHYVLTCHSLCGYLSLTMCTCLYVTQGAGAGENSLLKLAVSVAERNYDRVNSSEFIHALPKSVPVAMLTRYLNLIIEMGNAKKRNLQILHQLLRMREVNIRTEDR